MKLKSFLIVSAAMMLAFSQAWSEDAPAQAMGSGLQIAPAFSEKDTNGHTVALKDYLGQVVLLNFWGTWCPPCRAEIPALEKLAAAHKGQLGIIGAAVFSSEDKVLQFYSDFQLNYPVIMGSYELMGDYGKISAIPTTVIINRKGEIVATVVGSRTQAQYEEMIKPLLAE